MNDVIQAVQVVLADEGPRILCYGDQPLGACYAAQRGALGTLKDAAAQLRDGATVWVDRRDGAYLRLRTLWQKEAAR